MLFSERCCCADDAKNKTSKWKKEAKFWNWISSHPRHVRWFSNRLWKLSCPSVSQVDWPNLHFLVKVRTRSTGKQGDCYYVNCEVEREKKSEKFQLVDSFRSKTWEKLKDAHIFFLIIALICLSSAFPEHRTWERAENTQRKSDDAGDVPTREKNTRWMKKTWDEKFVYSD